MPAGISSLMAIITGEAMFPVRYTNVSQHDLVVLWNVAFGGYLLGRVPQAQEQPSPSTPVVTKTNRGSPRQANPAGNLSGAVPLHD